MIEKKKQDARKEYFPPKIVHTEKMEARATSCSLGDFTCNPGPIQS